MTQAGEGLRPGEELDGLISDVRAWVEMQRGFGVDSISMAAEEGDAAAAPNGAGPASAGASPAEELAASADVPQAADAGADAAVEALEAYRCEIKDCEKCPLSRTRTNFVFGVGNPRARLMFVGEAPGADEDLQGEPFVGQAGKLLTKMIEAMGLSRKDVYIANILKCRPPGNRTPSIDEMVTCMPYVLRQIEVIKPEIICALGAVALKGLLRDPGLSITRLRGRFMDWNGVKLMPTFHPAYLLRSPSQKRFVWEDLQLIMAELGISPKP